MNKMFERTENGTTTVITAAEALAEANHAMMAGQRDVKTMSAGSSRYDIEYKDGRKVRLVKIDAPAEQLAETDRHGNRIIEVKGKRYVVSEVTPARPKTPGAVTWVPEAYLSYWSERNGQTFGPTRFAKASNKPGTLGRAVWDAANR